MMPFTQKNDRFEDRMGGILIEGQILERDVAGASYRIVASGEGEQFLSDKSKMETLRASDMTKPAFIEAIKQKINALIGTDIKKHILFGHLKMGQVTPLTNEAIYWNIEVAKGQPSISKKAAQALIDSYESLCRLPKEVHSKYPLYIEGYSLGHATRVGVYAALLAQKLGNENAISTEDAARAGFFHDLGKIHPHVHALVKSPNRLTEEEYRKVKMHPIIGATIWNDLDSKSLSLAHGKYPHMIVHDGILEHHVRPDGKGYPAFVKSESFSEIGKVVAVADSFDAMTSMRVYKGNGIEGQIDYVYEEMKRCGQMPWNADMTKFKNPEGQFDRRLVRLFLQLEPKPIFFKKY